MKKIILALVVLAIALPASADVDITCAQEGNEPNVTVSYDNGETESVRAFALEIMVDACGIDTISCLSSEYYIYPGDIDIEDGQVQNFGSCVVSVDGNSAIVEMGSLYAAEDPCHTTAPPDQDDLLYITLTLGEGETCDMSIKEEPIRGGVVMEDLSDPTINTPGCTVTIPSSGPACWSYDCFDCGDADGDCSLTFGDISILIAGWPPNPYNPCADLDKDAAMTFGDINVLIANWPPNGACANCGSCTPVP
jgi:hypothetical protein